MYDPPTAELIQAIPILDGLNREELPQRLTDAYTQIATLRLRIEERPQDDEFEQLLEELQRLASTCENYALSTQEHTLRSSAAFVSATAHHLITLVQDNLDLDTSRPPAALHSDWISPRISALLLFLIAGYPSDAAEMSRSIIRYEDGTVESVLTNALSDLGTGDISTILNAEVDSDVVNDDYTEEGHALTCLWGHILDGLIELSSEILTLVSRDDNTADQFFHNSIRLSIADLQGAEGQEYFRQVSAFSGPHHLATLLLATAEELRRQAATGIPSPTGIDHEAWGNYLETLAHKRPLVWANHLDAIEQGYLTPGTSSCVSFPTGAGKSTLAELKIATCVLRDRLTVYLAPTHALVGQVARSLRDSFPNASVRDSMISDGYYSVEEDPSLPDIAVMTPERCLMLLGLYPDAFMEVSLIVFDECHLLHPSRSLGDRRSIDAMLCLLRLLDVAPDTDILLLSAMMANSSELSRWLQDTLQRPCLGLDLAWKPTRQVRGCVIYKAEDINVLAETMESDRNALSLRQRQKQPGVAIIRKLKAQPYALVCLKQTWSTTNIADYRSVVLLNTLVQLGSNARWQITGNKNVVASELAAQMSRAGIKTIVFSQNRSHCESIARKTEATANNTNTELVLSEYENLLLERIVVECGGIDHAFTPYGTTSVVHHSLLFAAERRLSESVFSRADGPNVIVATPTLAQGMNLPAEAVIIAGDERFDAALGQASQLGAHELLNAAGRAGRAGFAAQGIVLVVPTEIVAFNSEDNKIGSGWRRLRQGIFSKSDQCLDIDDPLTLVLDDIQINQATPNPNSLYCLNRLPIQSNRSAEVGRSFLRRSLGAWRSRQRGDESDYEARIETAIAKRQTLLADPDSISDLDRIAAASGQSIELITKVNQFLESGTPEVGTTTNEWTQWLFDMASSDLPLAKRAFGNMNSLDLFDIDSGDDSPISAEVVQTICGHVLRWMSGETLREIERGFATPDNRLGKCAKARKLFRDCVPNVSYLAGLVAMVHEHRLLEDEKQPITLATLASCIREGFDCPQQLAIHHVLHGTYGRVQTHNIYEAKADALPLDDPACDFKELCDTIEPLL